MTRLSTALLLFTLSFSCLTMAVDSTQQLASLAQQELGILSKQSQQREAAFNHTEAELQQLKVRLETQRATLERQNNQLAQSFSTNEEKLAKLEQQLRLEAGSLGEVFGVVRQNAKILQAEQQRSVATISANNYVEVVDDIVAATQLPSMPQLKGLWFAFTEQISASAELRKLMVPYRNGAGQLKTVAAVRLGAYGLVDKHGYLEWSNSRGDAHSYRQQPDDTPNIDSLSDISSNVVTSVVIDPSRGAILQQLATTPSWQDRLAAGGVVGKTILGLLTIGLFIALVRGIALTRINVKIKRQLKIPETPGNNPLGRLLAAYDKEKPHSAEALELRLLEVVVDEQADLERGLSMLKLLAALAPMLGLLGTVTGMIETFQVITQFGNNDPTIMAGGISMALVTTVLGLVAAMPLLLAHNILSSQAESIANVLEKQGIGIVAQQAELDHSKHIVQQLSLQQSTKIAE